MCEAERNFSKLSATENEFWSTIETRLSYLSILPIENYKIIVLWRGYQKSKQLKAVGEKVYGGVSAF